MQKGKPHILIIPKQIFDDNNMMKMTLEKLYVTPLNKRYVKSQIKFACGQDIDVTAIMDRQVYDGDDCFCDKRNKFQVLSDINEKIIKETIEILKYSDHHLQRGNWEYTEYSMRGDTWHPEDLFLESESNRKVPQWQELDVEFNPWKPNVGNPYMTESNPYPYPAWRLNPRHYASIDNNGEDRRTQINKKIPY